MDKFRSIAQDLLAEVNRHVEESSNARPPKPEDFGWFVKNEDFELSECILRVQTLFYFFNPTMPLYNESLSLGSVFTESLSMNIVYRRLQLMLNVFIDLLDFQES